MELENEIQVALPQLNQAAPNFEAVTTHGVKKLDGYKGKWLVLFSITVTGKRVSTEIDRILERSREFISHICYE